MQCPVWIAPPQFCATCPVNDEEHSMGDDVLLGEKHEKERKKLLGSIRPSLRPARYLLDHLSNYLLRRREASSMMRIYL